MGEPTPRLGDPILHMPGGSPVGGAAAMAAPDAALGSEGTTPLAARHRPGGSPQRGLPNQQQQMQTFQRYLQQQLLLQHRGRYGPSAVDDSSCSASGVASGGVSRSGTPRGSPLQADSCASSPLNGPQDGSPPPPTQGLPPVYPGAFGSRLSLAGSRAALQQQGFEARLQGAGGEDAGPPQQQVWFDASATDAGSAPVSSRQPSITYGSTTLLARAESTFSSWGLPTPTTGGNQEGGRPAWGQAPCTRPELRLHPLMSDEPLSAPHATAFLPHPCPTCSHGTHALQRSLALQQSGPKPAAHAAGCAGPARLLRVRPPQRRRGPGRLPAWRGAAPGAGRAGRSGSGGSRGQGGGGRGRGHAVWHNAQPRHVSHGGHRRPGH